MNGAVFVDASGEPLRPPPIWLDHRSQRECDAAKAQAGDLLRSKALQVLSPINTLAKVLWVREHEPEVYTRAPVCADSKRLDPVPADRYVCGGCLGRFGDGGDGPL